MGAFGFCFWEQQPDTSGDCEACLEVSVGDGVFWFCVDAVGDVSEPSNPTCEEKSEVKFDVPSSSLTLPGMLPNARAMFSGAACIALCLLPDFWTLPGAGDDVETMEDDGS